jgi:hypothetical protein
VSEKFGPQVLDLTTGDMHARLDRIVALLERVAKLERALEEVDNTISLFGEHASLDYIRATVQEALSD